MEIDFGDVVLTPDALQRWQDEVTKAATQMVAIGITPQPGEPVMRELDFGRLQVVVNLGPGFSVLLHAERGEWTRVSSN